MTTKKNAKFIWGKEQQQAFEKINILMSKEMLLGYFDKNDKTVLVADASLVGLGAVLIQTTKGVPRIISFAAKSLSSAERRDAQT